MSASGATHLITSAPLCGSKTQKLLTSKKGRLVHVVKPEWVYDSIEEGRRLSEHKYHLDQDQTNQKLASMWTAKR
jgi:hypothetical protein